MYMHTLYNMLSSNPCDILLYGKAQASTGKRACDMLRFLCMSALK